MFGQLEELTTGLSVKSVKSDAAEYTVAAAGGLAAIAGVNYAWSYLPEPLGHPAVKPALKIVAGSALGIMVPNLVKGKWGKALGLGAGVTLALVGLVGVLNSFDQTAGIAPALTGFGADDAMVLADGFAGDRMIPESTKSFNALGGDRIIPESTRSFNGMGDASTYIQ